MSSTDYRYVFSTETVMTKAGGNYPETVLFFSATHIFPIGCQQNPTGAHSDCSFSLSVLQTHTYFFITHILTTLWHPYQHTHNFSSWLYSMPKQKTGIKGYLFYRPNLKKRHHLIKNSKKYKFQALPSEWKPLNKDCIIL